MYFHQFDYYFLQETNQKIRDTLDKCSICKHEKQQLDEERQEFIKQKTKLELEVKDLEEGIKEDSNLKNTSKKQMEKLEAKIKAKEEALAKITPEYNNKKTEESQLTARLEVYVVF